MTYLLSNWLTGGFVPVANAGYFTYYNHPDKTDSMQGALSTPHAVCKVVNGILREAKYHIYFNDTARFDYVHMFFDSEGHLIKQEHWNGTRRSGMFKGRTIIFSREGIVSDVMTNPKMENRDKTQTYDTPTLSYGYSYSQGEKITPPIISDSNIQTSRGWTPVTPTVPRPFEQKQTAAGGADNSWLYALGAAAVLFFSR